MVSNWELGSVIYVSPHVISTHSSVLSPSSLRTRIVGRSTLSAARSLSVRRILIVGRLGCRGGLWRWLMRQLRGRSGRRRRWRGNEFAHCGVLTQTGRCVRYSLTALCFWTCSSRKGRDLMREEGGSGNGGGQLQRRRRAVRQHLGLTETVRHLICVFTGGRKGRRGGIRRSRGSRHKAIRVEEGGG